MSKESSKADKEQEAESPSPPSPLSEKLSTVADKLERLAQAFSVIKEQLDSAVADIRVELRSLKKQDK